MGGEKWGILRTFLERVECNSLLLSTARRKNENTGHSQEDDDQVKDLYKEKEI